jgi:hypothetical protein
MIEEFYLVTFEESAELTSRAEKILRQGGTPMVDYINSGTRRMPGREHPRKERP